MHLVAQVRVQPEPGAIAPEVSRETERASEDKNDSAEPSADAATQRASSLITQTEATAHITINPADTHSRLEVILTNLTGPIPESGRLSLHGKLLDGRGEIRVPRCVLGRRTVDQSRLLASSISLLPEQMFPRLAGRPGRVSRRWYFTRAPWLLPEQRDHETIFPNGSVLIASGGKPFNWYEKGVSNADLESPSENVMVCGTPWRFGNDHVHIGQMDIGGDIEATGFESVTAFFMEEAVEEEHPPFRARSDAMQRINRVFSLIREQQVAPDMAVDGDAFALASSSCRLHVSAWVPPRVRSKPEHYFRWWRLMTPLDLLRAIEESTYGVDVDAALGHAGKARFDALDDQVTFSLAFIALEMLVHRLAERLDLFPALEKGALKAIVKAAEDAIDANVRDETRRQQIKKKLSDLRRPAVRDVIEGVLAHFNVPADDLWPDGLDMSKGVRTIVETRNGMFHAGAESDVVALHHAQARLEILFDRLMLSLLKPDLLGRYTDAIEWKLAKLRAGTLAST